MQSRSAETTRGAEQQNRLRLSHPDAATLQIELAGNWSLQNELPDSSFVIEHIRSAAGLRRIFFAAGELAAWDSTLLSFLRKVKEEAKQLQIELDESALPRGVQKLLALATAVPEKKDTGHDDFDDSLLSRVGSMSIGATVSAEEFFEFIGETFVGFLKLLRGKARFRRVDFLLLLQETGAHALPIITLINILMGVILAFVGAVQLSQFGAQIFVANLVGIAMTREMAPMMTAIILAGRSGASFAAQIGTMTVNEEVDALKTMGFSPIEFLVLPRLLALALMVPLLVLYADFLGILGGAAVGVTMLDLSFTQYMEQTRLALAPKQFALGLIKGSIYGVLVAIAGCYQGIKCGRSASAVGAATTAAVVRGIIYVVIASAVTTVIYSMLGL